jgi:hypothetical protein
LKSIEAEVERSKLHEAMQFFWQLRQLIVGQSEVDQVRQGRQSWPRAEGVAREVESLQQRQVQLAWEAGQAVV